MPRPTADNRRNSAITLAKHLLTCPRDLLVETQLKELLSTCIWKFTEAQGKWNTRYRSRAAVGMRLPNIRHEHVFQRDLIIQKMLETPSDAQSLMEASVGCVVTVEEHDRLEHGVIDGWERYRVAGIVVVDTETGLDAEGLY